MTDPTPTITVQVNGRERSLPARQTVAALLEALELRPELVVVERNREILERGLYGQVELEDGDTLELVHFVGGG